MEAQDATHVCTDCGKGFPSGRAYGGHWRIHVTERRRAAAESDVVLPENPELPESDVASSSRLPEKPELSAPCRVCKKSFPTEKALAGHMRCHPEREWRGINPPPESPSSSGEVRDFPASWGQKGRRSQSSLDFAIATEALLELSRGEIGRVSEKKRKSRDDDGGGGNYKCSECERSFSTFQALGGHRSTHNRELHKNKKLKIKMKKSGDDDIAIDGGTGKNDCRLIVKSSEDQPKVLESSSAMPESVPRRRFGFDLNEPPCDDIEGEEFGNTN